MSLSFCFSPFHRSPVYLLPFLRPFQNPAILPNYVAPFVISGSVRLRPKYHYLWRERNIFIQTNRPYQGLFISTKGNVPLSDEKLDFTQPTLGPLLARTTGQSFSLRVTSYTGYNLSIYNRYWNFEFFARYLSITLFLCCKNFCWNFQFSDRSANKIWNPIKTYYWQ